MLNGAKTFTTHGRVGHVMVAMAVTDRAAGHHGISAFVVERGTRGDVGRAQGEQAGHARQRHERGGVRRLPHSRGPARWAGEGEGFVNALQVLDAGRIGIAALAVGLAQGAHEAAVRYAKERRPVRQADRLVPGDPVEAGRRRDGDRGGAAAHLPGGAR